MPLTEWEAAARLVRDLGFPAAVAIYLLTRLDRLLREHTRALHELADAFREHNDEHHPR